MAVIVDFITHGRCKYRRNLGNTALTVLLTISWMTALYCLIWYPNLNTLTLVSDSDFV
ncbi:hypothetical protein ABVK25_009904, partial [Lepraria finkii]